MALLVGLGLQAIPAEDANGASKKPRPLAVAVAAPLAPTLPPDLVAPKVAIDSDLTKELARGTLLAQLESKGRLSKLAYEPPSKLLQPYQAGSLDPAVAFELIESGRQFVDAPAAEAYAQQIVDRLVSTAPEPRLKLRVKILADPSYGAYATDTGLILVRLGTFNADPTKGAATADELALLLGHEIGHILMGHIDGRKQMRDLSRLISYSATAALTYSAVKDGKMVNGKFQGRPDKDMMVKSLLGGLTTSTLVEELLVPSFNRQRELEADRIGIDLARRAGYVVAEGEVLRFVAKHGEDSLRRSRRLEALREVVDVAMAQVAAKVARESGGSNAQLIKDLVTVPSKMMSEQIVRLIVRQTKEHPDPNERMAFVARYVEQNYGEGDTGPDGRILKRDMATISAVCREPGLSTLVAQVRRASDVRLLLAETKPSEDAAVQARQAQQVLRQAGYGAAARSAAPPTKKPGKTPPAPTVRTAGVFGVDAAAMTWETQGLLFSVEGDTGLAHESWRRGLKSNYASTDMARNLDNGYSGVEGNGREAVVRRYVKLVGTSDPVLDFVVAIAAEKGDMASAEVAAARCVTYGGGELYPRCAAALGYDPLIRDQGGARTAEGRKAFATKGIEKSFRDLSKITGIF